MRLWSSIKDNIFRFAFGPATVGVLRLLTRVRLIGRSNAMRFRGLTKHRGGIVVCNHTHYLDAAFAVWALWPRRLWFTSQAQNFSLPVAGRILSFWDVVGVVGGEGGKELFNAQLGVLLNEGKSVVIYPEGNLRPFEKELQPFHKGAFHVAITEQVPILPIVAVPETRKMWWGGSAAWHARRSVAAGLPSAPSCQRGVCGGSNGVAGPSFSNDVHSDGCCELIFLSFLIP